MDFGALIFPTDLSVRPDVLARELEDRGFESMWVTEHTHIPISRLSPWPGGADLPDEYKRTLDPFVALTSAAAATTKLKLATGICLVAQHDPIVLAKTISSLDLLSGGRFIFGIGVGWNAEEMADHGVDPSRRRGIAREKVLAMQELWTNDKASYRGEFVNFEPTWSWPKPVQQPHPPVVMGGAGGPVTFRHIIEYCDGWIPIHGRRSVLGRIDDLRAAADSAGRDPATLEISVFGVPGDPPIIDAYRKAGVSRCVLGLPSAPMETIVPLLDRYAGLLDT